MADIEKYVKMKENNIHADVIRVTMENDGFMTPDDIEDFFINAEIFEPYFLLRWKKFGKSAIQKKLETDGFSPEDIENFFSWNYLRGRFAIQAAPKASGNHPAPGTLKLASMNYPMPTAAPTPPPQAQMQMPPPQQMMMPPPPAPIPAPAPPPDLNSMTVIERIKYEKAQKEAAAAQQKLIQQQQQQQQQQMYPPNQQLLQQQQQQQQMMYNGQQQMMYPQQPGAPQMMYGQQPMYGQQQMMYNGQQQMMGGPPQQQQAPASGGVQSKMLESIRQARLAKEQAAAAAAAPPVVAPPITQYVAPPEPVVKAPPPPPPGAKRRPPGPGKKAPSRTAVEKYVKKFDKYVQMKNKNFSEATIRRKMGADGFDEDEVLHFLSGEFKYGPLYETDPGDDECVEDEEEDNQEQEAYEISSPESPIQPKSPKVKSPTKKAQSPRKKNEKRSQENDDEELPPHELTIAEKNSNSKIQEFLEALLAAAFELQDPEEDDSKTFLTEHAADVLEKMLRSQRDTGGAPGNTPDERKEAVLAFLDTEGIRRHLDDAEITQNALLTFFGGIRRQVPANERLHLLNSHAGLGSWHDPDEAAGDNWLESLELTGATKDKYDLYVKYVRDGENKDFIRGHMSAHGLSQKEIAAFFKAFPCGNGKSAQSKRGDRATTIPAYIPKPRVAGSGTPQISPRLLDDASMEKNTAYFAEMARVSLDYEI